MANFFSQSISGRSPKHPKFRNRNLLRAVTVWGLFTALIILFQNCGVPEKGLMNPLHGVTNSFATPEVYFQRTSKIKVEVYYEPGAEPYTGSGSNSQPLWDIAEANLDALFQYRSSKPQVLVPKTDGEMKPLSPQSRTSWTTSDILNLARANREADSTASESRFYVYFVKGYFDSGSGPNQNVIGVSIGGTPVIAIFKDVIRSTATTGDVTNMIPKYVEQSTIVHEMGHALGFVNNGVPMAHNHQDVDHGAHTTNTECVMYWQNEGVSGLLSFVQRYITNGTVVMWGPEVLADAQGFSR